VCHGGSGPGSPTFDLAGTVFAFEGQRVPADGATVRLIDGAGNTQTAGTNQAGNFWMSESDLVLRFPIWVSVDFGGASIEMKTPIFRARSCAECHGDAAGPSSVGRVFAIEDPP
jgi:hypothetical protein